ncbi:MAG: hypothetical protein BGO09_15270 [Bacteroidetes bacterium 47-18]|nr:MAG: hypothetical protein BGO09_15270 [Bacteroidetes bacterium 47-18]
MLVITGVKISSAQGFDNIRQLKLEIVLREMNLNKDTEKKFLPLYTRYSDETLAIKKKLKTLEESTDNSNPQRKIQEREQYKQQILDIEKRYKDQFLRIISPSELDKMYKGEEKFKQKLLELRSR